MKSFLILALIYGLALSGWLMNIYHLAHATSINGLVIVEAIGIPIIPLGAVLGWVL